MKKNRSSLYRIILMLMILLLMIPLSGCRKRISNNSQIEPTVYDTDGYITELYDMRREELGLSVADKPFINLLKASDDQEPEIEGEDSEVFDDWDDEFEDDWEDEEEDDSEDTTPSVTAPTTPSTSGTVTRPSVTVQPLIRVTFDPNGGKASSTISNVRTGNTYGTLPTATKDGYKFKGWYTAKKKGSKVTSTTKVTKTSAHTLYAHWTKDNTKTYTVSFDGNAEGETVVLSSDSMTLKKGDTYGTLPTAKRSGYTLVGWFTEADGGSQVKKGEEFTETSDITLYAHWKYDPYASWEKTFKETANSIDEDAAVYYEYKKGKSIIEACRGTLADDEETPDYVIIFLDDFNDEDAAAAAGTASETYAESTIIVMPKDAVSASDEEILLYKLKLLDTMHGVVGEDELARASEELEVEVFDPYVL